MEMVHTKMITCSENYKIVNILYEYNDYNNQMYMSEIGLVNLEPPNNLSVVYVSLDNLTSIDPTYYPERGDIVLYEHEFELGSYSRHSITLLDGKNIISRKWKHFVGNKNEK